MLDAVKLFENLFGELMSEETSELLKFMETFNSENVSVTQNGNAICINVNADVKEEDYNGFVKNVINTIKSIADGCEFTNGLVLKDNLVLELTVGNRPTEIYEYVESENDFDYVGRKSIESDSVDEKKECDDKKKDVYYDVKGNVDMNEGKDDNEKSGVEFYVKERNIDDDIDEMPFAEWLKMNIQDDIDSGFYDDYDFFDADEAIENLISIYGSDVYSLLLDDDDELVGIEVSIVDLCEGIEATDEDIDYITENEKINVLDFMARCISELGFSDVVPEIDYDEDNVDCTQDIEKYKNLFFKLYF